MGTTMSALVDQIWFIHKPARWLWWRGSVDPAEVIDDGCCAPHIGYNVRIG